jgi:hypothetical protein
MPSTTLGRRWLMERWFGENCSDHEVMEFLRSHGFQEIKNGLIRRPVSQHNVSKDEWECIWYLIEEWDFDLESWDVR